MENYLLEKSVDLFKLNVGLPTWKGRKGDWPGLSLSLQHGLFPNLSVTSGLIVVSPVISGCSVFRESSRICVFFPWVVGWQAWRGGDQLEEDRLPDMTDCSWFYDSSFFFTLWGFGFFNFGRFWSLARRGRSWFLEIRAWGGVSGIA